MAGETICSFWELQSTGFQLTDLKISYVTGSRLRVVKEFTFCGIKVRLWRSSIWRSKQRIQDFIHWYRLQGHMKSHEKESIHLIALSPNISSLENETKSPSIFICNEKKNQIFYMLWQYKLDKNLDLTFEENRSLLSSMTAKICFKMLMKSSVNHFQSTEFSIRDWQTLKLVLFYNQF